MREIYHSLNYYLLSSVPITYSVRFTSAINRVFFDTCRTADIS